MSEEQQKVPFYKKSWFIILALIFFFPVGLYLMWVHTGWNKAAKWIITAAIALIAFSTLITGEDDSENIADTTEEQVATEETQSEPEGSDEETEEVPTEEETAEESEEEVETESGEQEVSAEEDEEVIEEEEAEEIVGIGETLTVDDIDFTVNEWFERDSVGTGLSATANDTYIVLDVTVTNNQNEAAMLMSNYFKIVDGEVVYEPDGVASTYMNQEIAPDNTGFLAEEINPGSSRDAYVVYDVAPGVIDSETKQLQVQSGIFGTQTGIIDLQ